MAEGKDSPMGFTDQEILSIEGSLAAFYLKLQATLEQHESGISTQTQKGREACQAVQACLKECESTLDESIATLFSGRPDAKIPHPTEMEARKMREWKEQLLRHGYDTIVSGIIQGHDFRLMNALSKVHGGGGNTANITPERIEEETRKDLSQIWRNMHFSSQTFQTAIKANRGSKQFHAERVKHCRGYLRCSRVLAEEGLAFGWANQGLIDILDGDKTQPLFLSHLKKGIERWLEKDNRLRRAERDYEKSCKALVRAKISYRDLEKRPIKRSVDMLTSLSRVAWVRADSSMQLIDEDLEPVVTSRETSRSHWVSALLNRLVSHYFPQRQGLKARAGARLLRYGGDQHAPSVSSVGQLIRNNEEEQIIILPSVNDINAENRNPLPQEIALRKKQKKRGKFVEVSLLDEKGHEKPLTRVQAMKTPIDGVLADLDPALQPVGHQIVKNIERTVQLYHYVHGELTPRLEATQKCVAELKAEQAELKAEQAELNKKLEQERQHRLDTEKKLEQERLNTDKKLEEMMNRMDRMQSQYEEKLKHMERKAGTAESEENKKEVSDDEQRSPYRMFG